MRNLINAFLVIVIICFSVTVESGDIDPLDPFGDGAKPVSNSERSKVPTSVIVTKVENMTIGNYGSYVTFALGYEKSPICAVKISHSGECLKDIRGPNTDTIDVLSIMAEILNDTRLAEIIIGKSVFNKDTDDGIRQLCQVAKKRHLKFSRSHKTVEKIIVEDTVKIWEYLRMSDIYAKCQNALYLHSLNSGNDTKAKKMAPEIEKIGNNMKLAERVLQSLR